MSPSEWRRYGSESFRMEGVWQGVLQNGGGMAVSPSEWRRYGSECFEIKEVWQEVL